MVARQKMEGCAADLNPRMVQSRFHGHAGFRVDIQQPHHQVFSRGRDGAPVLWPHLNREKKKKKNKLHTSLLTHGLELKSEEK